jgi:CRP-like cAMP-binding protein
VNGLAQIEKVMLLRRVDLFAHCSAEEVVRIAAIAGERHFTAGERIYGKNDPAQALYCVVDGKIELSGDNGARPRKVEARDSFGVTEILSGRLRRRAATARSDTVALAIDADDFFDLLSNNIDIVKALFREILTDRARSEGGNP